MSIERFRVGRDNFSYMIHCPETKQAALVDPGFDASVALELIASMELDLRYIINTHHHRDHTADNERVKADTGAGIMAHKEDVGHINGGVDRTVADAEIVRIGNVNLTIVHTPGHTKGGICLIVDDEAILTGDTLFIGDCGRTDLADGSDAEMYESLQRLKTLPDELIVLPGHDYGPKPTDTLGDQKLTNKIFLAASLEEFARIP